MGHSGSKRLADQVLRLGIARLLCLVLSPITAHAQPVEEYQLKAAVLYNLAKFVDWPPSVFKSPTDPIAICVLGDSPIGAALQKAVSNELIEDRRFLIRQLPDVQRAEGCQIFFFSSSEKTHWHSIFSEFSAGGVLTVGESDRFVLEGGMVNLKIEGGKIRIQVNLASTQRAGVQISSKLLSLAQIVKK